MNPKRAPPALPYEIMEEIILRLPPADPASLMRAALVCKPWYRFIANPVFPARFRRHHGVPPVIGLLCNFADPNAFYTSFMPTTKPACDLQSLYAQIDGSAALDARHGHVLLRRSNRQFHGLVLWDPISGRERGVPDAPFRANTAAVLCAAGDNCEHLDCRAGPVIIVAIGTDLDSKLCVARYESHPVSWSGPHRVASDVTHSIDHSPAALAGDALYFCLDSGSTILRYDLPTTGTALHQLPAQTATHLAGAAALTTMGGGGIGVAKLDGDGTVVRLWTWDVNRNGEWTLATTVDLVGLLPLAAHPIPTRAVGVAPAMGAIFVEGDHKTGVYQIQTGSDPVMVCDGDGYEPEEGEDYVGFYAFVPYATFYTPVMTPLEQLEEKAKAKG